MTGGPAPKRIRLRRARGWRKPVGTIVVSCPGRWGNPFAVDPSGTPATRAEAVTMFADALADGLAGYPDVEQIRRELGGHDLACWCPAGEPCHADVLLRVANP